MNKLIHTQNIDTIHMHFEMQLYCPQGFEHYTGTFDVDFVLGSTYLITANSINFSVRSAEVV